MAPGLLSIPLEARTRIYHLLLVDQDILSPDSLRVNYLGHGLFNPIPPTLRDFYNLSLTCAQVRSEVRPIFYGCNVFQLSVPIATELWLDIIGDANAALIRHVRCLVFSLFSSSAVRGDIFDEAPIVRRPARITRLRGLRSIGGVTMNYMQQQCVEQRSGYRNIYLDEVVQLLSQNSLLRARLSSRSWVPRIGIVRQKGDNDKSPIGIPSGWQFRFEANHYMKVF